MATEAAEQAQHINSQFLVRPRNCQSWRGRQSISQPSADGKTGEQTRLPLRQIQMALKQIDDCGKQATG
jgi:hypothetical protein